MSRLFTCVWIPSNLKEKIIVFQKELMKNPIRAKFVELENIHITITFLGDVKENEIDTLKKKLDYAVKNVKKFHVKLEGLKLIPNENFIRVIGINVKGEDISNLIRTVGKTIDGKYYESAKLTLCRVKNVTDKESLKKFIEKNREIKIGEFEVESVCLVESKLTRRGPIYRTIHKSVLV